MSTSDVPNNLSVAEAKALLGVTSKRAKRDRSPATCAAATEARRALAAAKLEAHISEVLAASLPLTPDDRARLAMLLRGTS